MADLHPSESLSDYVVGVLRKEIYAGTLAPGSRLVERSVGERFGVSHIPVREALARLVDEGLLEHLPRRGVRVAELDHLAVEEISSVRVLLEQEVVRRVQAHWTPDAERVLRQTVKDMIAHARSLEADQVFAMDCLFHEQLWQLSESAVLTELATMLRSRVNRFLLAANRALSPRELTRHAGRHAQLLDTIASGDAERAAQAMQEHIQIATRRILSIG